MKIIYSLGLVTALAAGCATMSVPPPNEEIANSQAVARGAAEIGARNIPAAALALKLAEDEIAEAKRLVEEDECEAARYMAIRAANDAELALTLTRLHQARASAAAAPAMDAPTATVQPALPADPIDPAAPRDPADPNKPRSN